MGRRMFANGRHDSAEVMKAIESSLFLALPFAVVATACDDPGELAVVVAWGKDAEEVQAE